MNMDQRLPFFVYGTLMQGHGNHRLFSDNIRGVDPAIITDAVMTVSGAIPFVHLQTSASAVHGQLIEVFEAQYETVLARLDRLEGFRGPGDPTNLYDRTTVWASAYGFPVAAWSYLITPDRAATTIIRSGDYNNQEN